MASVMPMTTITSPPEASQPIEKKPQVLESTKENDFPSARKPLRLRSDMFVRTVHSLRWGLG